MQCRLSNAEIWSRQSGGLTFATDGSGVNIFPGILGNSALMGFSTCIGAITMNRVTDIQRHHLNLNRTWVVFRPKTTI